jgi:cell division protein FtsB
MRFLTVILIALFVMLQYHLWVGEGSVPAMWQLQEAVKEQRKENSELAERNAALTAEVKDLKSGLDAIEERARHEMGMIKQGETFIQIVDKPASGD